MPGQPFGRSLLCRCNSREELIPSMMLAGRSGASAGKSLVQQTDVGDGIHFQPSPVGKRSATGSAHLVSKKLHGTAVNPVVVRLHNARFVQVNKCNQSFLIDRGAQQLIHIPRTLHIPTYLPIIRIVNEPGTGAPWGARPPPGGAGGAGPRSCDIANR
jgi:hypothetical protein